MADAIHYTTLQEILEESGLSHAVHGENANGVVDGVNKIFTVDNKPLVDTNNDDTVTKDDVRVYVDGVPAPIDTVDAQFGIITLITAPAADAEVTTDYQYSAVSLAFVAKVRSGVEAWINRYVRKIDSLPYTAVPEDISYIAMLRGAAKLQIRDYGYNQDAEGTSKDGYKKLSEAKNLLMEYINAGGLDDSDSLSGVNGLDVQSEGSLFERPDNYDRPRHSDRGW
jgi:hypothetical protein